MEIISSFLWLKAMGQMYFSADQILRILWLSQNYVGKFCWMSFILLCLLARLPPERLVFYFLGMFGSPIYCCLANRLCFTILPTNLVYCSCYLFQMASLCPGVLVSLSICLFVMGIMLFLPVLPNWISIAAYGLICRGGSFERLFSCKALF